MCRKTLADSRPRVRGRFARNDDAAAVMPHETKKALAAKAKQERKAGTALRGHHHLSKRWFGDSLRLQLIQGNCQTCAPCHQAMLLWVIAMMAQLDCRIGSCKSSQRRRRNRANGCWMWISPCVQLKQQLQSISEPKIWQQEFTPQISLPACLALPSALACQWSPDGIQACLLPWISSQGDISWLPIWPISFLQPSLMWTRIQTWAVAVLHSISHNNCLSLALEEFSLKNSLRRPNISWQTSRCLWSAWRIWFCTLAQFTAWNFPCYVVIWWTDEAFSSYSNHSILHATHRLICIYRRASLVLLLLLWHPERSDSFLYRLVGHPLLFLLNTQICVGNIGRIVWCRELCFMHCEFSLLDLSCSQPE